MSPRRFWLFRSKQPLYLSNSMSLIRAMMRNGGSHANQARETGGQAGKMQQNGLLLQTGAPHFSRIVRFLHAFQRAGKEAFCRWFSAAKGFFGGSDWR